jgi:hypothetical protein
MGQDDTEQRNANKTGFSIKIKYFILSLFLPWLTSSINPASGLQIILVVVAVTIPAVELTMEPFTTCSER